MTAGRMPPQLDQPAPSAPLIDVIDARARCPNRVPGRLVLDEEKRLGVELLEPAPAIQVGSRLVLRCPQRRMSGLVTDRTQRRITVELLRVYRTEQRTWPRVAGNVRCLCRFEKSWTWPERVIDVSVGGVAFVTKKSASLGEPVTILLSLPLASGPWRLRGRVVRVAGVGDVNCVAVEFVDLPEAARVRLVRYGSEQLSDEQRSDEQRSAEATPPPP
ncbi:MAG: hypothetical protein ACI9U2_004365 [Bradymonadia bacterium]|jgi:hypothetical protein